MKPFSEMTMARSTTPRCQPSGRRMKVKREGVQPMKAVGLHFDKLCAAR